MIEIDIRELSDLELKLKSVPRTFEGQQAYSRALLNAAEWLERMMYINTPVSNGGDEYIPKKAGGDRAYARGGALVQSLKRRKSKFKRYGEYQVIVGFSKERGMAGWRAHFTEYGYNNVAAGRRISGQEFMKRSEEQTRVKVERDFESFMQKEFDKLFGQ